MERSLTETGQRARCNLRHQPVIAIDDLARRGSAIPTTAHRTPAERPLARVRSDFCAPLFTPTFTPPASILCPRRAGGACGPSGRFRYFVLRPAIRSIRSYTATRLPSISPAGAMANLLLRYRQMANATNKRSRTTNIAT
jgi:hypothetical protein